MAEEVKTIEQSSLTDVPEFLNGLPISKEFAGKINADKLAAQGKPQAEQKEDVKGDGKENLETKGTEKKTDPPVKKEGNDVFNFEQGSEPVEIKDVESLIKTFSEKTSIDIKDINDFNKVLTQFGELKEKEKRLAEVEDKAEYFDALFTGMPDELFIAVDKYANNEDYKTFLKSKLDSKFDYSLPFKRHSITNVLDAYYPGDFTKEEIDEFEKDGDDKSIKIALKTAEEKYANDQKNNVESKDKYVEKQKKSQDAYREKLKLSAEVSFETFRADNNFSPKVKKTVKELMSDGVESINSLLFEKDGTWKKEAAEKLAYVLYGKDVIDYAKAIVSRRAESKANEDIITRGHDQPGKNNSGASNKSLEEEQALKAARELIPGGSTNPHLNKK